MLSDKPTQYGSCLMVVNFKEKTAMPPEHARGASARIYLYVADQYNLCLCKVEKRTYEVWDRMYPVSEWERWRNQKLGCVMGHVNRYIGQIDRGKCKALR